MQNITPTFFRKLNLLHILSAVLLGILAVYTAAVFGHDRFLPVSLLINTIIYIITVQFVNRNFSRRTVLIDFISLFIIQIVFRSAIWFFKAKYAAHTTVLIFEFIQIAVTFTYFYIKKFLKDHQLLISLFLLILMPPFSILQGISPGPFLYLILIFLILVSAHSVQVEFRFDFVILLLLMFLILSFCSLLVTFSIVNTLDHIFAFSVFFALLLYTQFISEQKTLLFSILPAFIFSVMIAFFYFFESLFFGPTSSSLKTELNSNLIAMMLEFSYVLILFYLFSVKNIRLRMVCITLAILILSGILLTASRTATGAVIISSFFLLILLQIRKNSRFHLVLKFIPALYFLVLFCVFIAAFILFSEDQNFLERTVLYGQTVSAVLENPGYFFVGTGDYGPYTLFRHTSIFNNINEELFLRNPNLPVTHPHNDMVSILYGSGISGLMLFLSIVYTILNKIFSSKNMTDTEMVFSAGILLFLIQGLFEPPASQFATGGFFWFITGILHSGRLTEKNTIDLSGKFSGLFRNKLFQNKLKKQFTVFIFIFFGAVILYLTSQRIVLQTAFEPVNSYWSKHLFNRSGFLDEEALNSFQRIENNIYLYWKIFPVTSGSYYIHARTLQEISSRMDPARNSNEIKFMNQQITSSYCNSLHYDNNPKACREFSELINFLRQDTSYTEYLSSVCGTSPENLQKKCSAINPYRIY